jgi:hypothetical protein
MRTKHSGHFTVRGRGRWGVRNWGLCWCSAGLPLRGWAENRTQSAPWDRCISARTPLDVPAAGGLLLVSRLPNLTQTCSLPCSSSPLTRSPGAQDASRGAGSRRAARSCRALLCRYGEACVGAAMDQDMHLSDSTSERGTVGMPSSPGSAGLGSLCTQSLCPSRCGVWRMCGRMDVVCLCLVFEMVSSAAVAASPEV